MAVEDRVVYTHWKDVARPASGVEYRAFGEGEIDWQPILRHPAGLLRRHLGGFEYERKVDSTLETLKEGSLLSRDNLLAAIERVRRAAEDARQRRPAVAGVAGTSGAICSQRPICRKGQIRYALVSRSALGPSLSAAWRTAPPVVGCCSRVILTAHRVA